MLLIMSVILASASSLSAEAISTSSALRLLSSEPEYVALRGRQRGDNTRAPEPEPEPDEDLDIDVDVDGHVKHGRLNVEPCCAKGPVHVHVDSRHGY